MTSALELSNKTMFSGSLKLVWAIFQALFIVSARTLIGIILILLAHLWVRDLFRHSDPPFG